MERAGVRRDAPTASAAGVEIGAGWGGFAYAFKTSVPEQRPT